MKIDLHIDENALLVFGTLDLDEEAIASFENMLDDGVINWKEGIENLTEEAEEELYTASIEELWEHVKYDNEDLKVDYTERDGEDVTIYFRLPVIFNEKEYLARKGIEL